MRLRAALLVVAVGCDSGAAKTHHTGDSAGSDSTPDSSTDTDTDSAGDTAPALPDPCPGCVALPGPTTTATLPGTGCDSYGYTSGISTDPGLSIVVVQGNCVDGDHVDITAWSLPGLTPLFMVSVEQTIEGQIALDAGVDESGDGPFLAVEYSTVEDSTVDAGVRLLDPATGAAFGQISDANLWTAQLAAANGFLLAENPYSAEDRRGGLLVFGPPWTDAMTVDDAVATHTGGDEDRLASMLYTVGDVDGDGLDDVVVSTYFAPKLLLSEDLYVDEGIEEATDLYVGLCTYWAVRTVGDVTGDGLSDFAVANCSSDLSPGGEVDVFSAPAAPATEVARIYDQEGEAATFDDGGLGIYAVGGLGDISGNGHPAIVVQESDTHFGESEPMWLVPSPLCATMELRQDATAVPEDPAQFRTPYLWTDDGALLIATVDSTTEQGAVQVMQW